MNEKLVQITTIDSLLADPGKVIDLSPEAAQMLLIGLVSLQPLLIQRALMGAQGGQEKEHVLTVPEVANQLKLSSYRVYELARQGTLKSVRLGKSVRVRPSAVAKYLAQQGG
jgi:excisionase family DNA binding protein